MKPSLLSIPCAFLLALLVSRITMQTLGISVSVEVFSGVVMIGTLLMFRRTLIELGVIALITGFAQMNVAGASQFTLNEDAVLAVLLAIILFPTAMRMMGMEIDMSRT